GDGSALVDPVPTLSRSALVASLPNSTPSGSVPSPRPWVRRDAAPGGNRITADGPRRRQTNDPGDPSPVTRWPDGLPAPGERRGPDADRLRRPAELRPHLPARRDQLAAEHCGHREPGTDRLAEADSGHPRAGRPADHPGRADDGRPRLVRLGRSGGV